MLHNLDIYQPWQPWFPCTKTCRPGGQQTRVRMCRPGRSCPQPVQLDQKPCNQNVPCGGG